MPSPSSGSSRSPSKASRTLFAWWGEPVTFVRSAAAASECLFGHWTKVLVDPDQPDMLAAVRTRERDAQSIEGTSTVGPVCSVERHEPLERGYPGWQLVTELHHILVGPLGRCLPSDDRGDGPNPVEVGLSGIVRECQHEGPHLRVQNVSLQRRCLPADR